MEKPIVTLPRTLTLRRAANPCKLRIFRLLRQHSTVQHARDPRYFRRVPLYGDPDAGTCYRDLPVRS